MSSGHTELVTGKQGKAEWADKCMKDEKKKKIKRKDKEKVKVKKGEVEEK